MYRLLTSVLGSFGLPSLLLTDDSIQDSCYEIWGSCANYYKKALMELWRCGRGGGQAIELQKWSTHCSAAYCS
jgi:hypothetical protein